MAIRRVTRKTFPQPKKRGKLQKETAQRELDRDESRRLRRGERWHLANTSKSNFEEGGKGNNYCKVGERLGERVSRVAATQWIRRRIIDRGRMRRCYRMP